MTAEKVGFAGYRIVVASMIYQLGSWRRVEEKIAEMYARGDITPEDGKEMFKALEDWRISHGRN